LKAFQIRCSSSSSSSSLTSSSTSQHEQQQPRRIFGDEDEEDLLSEAWKDLSSQFLSPEVLKYGFFYVKNAPLDNKMLSHGHRWAQWMFSLPMNEKRKFMADTDREHRVTTTSSSSSSILRISSSQLSENNPKGYYRFSGVGIEEEGDKGEDGEIEAFLMGNETDLSSRSKYYSLRGLEPPSNNATNRWPSFSPSRSSFSYSSSPSPFSPPSSSSSSSFRSFMLDYYAACTSTCDILLRGISIALFSPSASSPPSSASKLLKLHSSADHTLEMKHYPSSSSSSSSSSLHNFLSHLHFPSDPSSSSSSSSVSPTTRMKAHADLSTLTLLSSNQPGLQIYDPNSNSWLDIPFSSSSSSSPSSSGKEEEEENMILVNTGDILERWSNGVFVSTKHRVVSSPSCSPPPSSSSSSSTSPSSRYSIVYFCTPDWDADLRPLLPLSQTEKVESEETGRNVALFGDLVPYV
jgi:isopenicillin N synthase-like dioxygenase